MIALLRSATLISLRRTAADWRLQVAAAFGMVLAVGLICAGVIYSGALAETTLRNTLRSVPQDELNMTLRVFHALERPAFEATERYVGEQVYGPLSSYLEEPTLLIQTSTLFFTGLPQLDLANSDRPRGSLQAITGFEDHAQLIQGRWPQRAAGVVEVAIDADGAASLDLPTEQEFRIYHASGNRGAPSLIVRVVGVFRPLAPQAQYWQLGTVNRVTSTERSWTYMPLYASEEALLDRSLAEVLPGLVTDFTWLFPLETGELNAGQADRLRTTITGVANGVRANLPDSVWRTDLDDVLDRYASLLLLARVPLFLVVFLAVGVLLYYMFLIAGFGSLRLRCCAAAGPPYLKWGSSSLWRRFSWRYRQSSLGPSLPWLSWRLLAACSPRFQVDRHWLPLAYRLLFSSWEVSALWLWSSFSPLPFSGWPIRVWWPFAPPPPGLLRHPFCTAITWTSLYWS